MPDRPDLRKIATDIREALDSYPREALAEILTHVFQAYVVEGVPSVHAAQPERLNELEGLAFPDLIDALKLRLDVPELTLFEVQHGRVSVRVGSELVPVTMGADARRAAAAPLPLGPASQPVAAAATASAPPPAQQPVPGVSTVEVAQVRRPTIPAAAAAEAPRPSRGLSVNPGGGARPASVSASPNPPAARTASTQPTDDPGDDDAASKRFKLLGDRLMSTTLARRYLVRAHAEMARGEHEAAAESFRAAMDMVPVFLSARLGYAAALVRLGDVPRASQVLRAGIGRTASSNRHRAALLLMLGDVLVAGGDFFGAEDAYRQVLELVPTEGAASAGLARVHAKLGRYADSFSSLLVAARAGNTQR